MGLERLDKLIALNCNVTRKEARKLIKDGAVTVDSRLALRAEELLDSNVTDIAVNGFTFTLKDHIYIMMNKPSRVVSATKDPAKKTVVDIIPPSLTRRNLFPVGRLDRDTTGLLIITDDGDFAHKIMSPNHHVFKTYEAVLSYPIDANGISRLEGGITLEDGTECLPAKVIGFTDNSLPAARISIREGKYHQVKRMFSAVGNRVEQLRRIKIGSLCLDLSLMPGECRELTAEELNLIFIDE